MRKGYKNRNFRPIFRFISDMIQDRATVTMERQKDIVCGLEALRNALYKFNTYLLLTYLLIEWCHFQ